MSILNKHKQEFLASAIAPEVFEANHCSIAPHREPENPWDEDELPEAYYLLYPEDEDLPRRNDGRLTSSALNKVRAEFLVDGGWWFNGFDFETGERTVFGCYKPDSPRTDDKGKVIKYEHPRNQSAGIFAPGIPITIANSIFFGIDGWEAFRDNWEGDPEFCAWAFAKQHPEIPVGLTEGAKKAESVISQAYLCAAIPGIWNWIDEDAEKYRNFKGEEKRRKQLTRHLKPITGQGRELFLMFDEDDKPKTRKNVNHAQKVLGKVLSKEGCKVTYLTWDAESGKGIDDAIAANGSQWFNEVFERRLSLSAWLYWEQWLKRIDKQLNKPFLSADDIKAVKTESDKLLGIQSAKGTFKTGAIADYIQEYLREGKPVLLLSHRVQLVKELSERFGIDNAYNFRVSETKGALGIALCVDSLHSESQVQFHPHDWEDYILIMDEVKQVNPHTLISNQTAVADHRCEVLANLTELCQNADQIILSDADLSDRDLDYINSLAGNCNQKVIVNNFLPAKGRKLFNYPSQEAWLDALISHLGEGDKVLIPTDAQQAKSTWGAQTIESMIKHVYPHLRVLRIDSETIGNPEHEAFNAIADLNSLVSQYDVVIYTSVIGTGVSIDLNQHFDCVFSMNQGTQSENSTRQFLARLRDGVPRHCFFNKLGLNFLYGGETEAHQVERSQKAQTKRNLANLRKLEQNILGFGDYAVHRQAYCRYVANHNLGLSAYREIVLEGLRREGYDIITLGDLGEDDRKAIRDGMTETRNENYQQLISAIAQAETPSDSLLKELENKQELTDSQRHQLRKGKMEKLYGVEADKELVEQDDEGLYPQLTLLFWLTVGRDRVEDADHKKATAYAEKTGGKGYEPDFNRTQNQAKVQVAEALRLPEIIEMEGQEVTNDSLAWWWEHIQDLIAKHYNTESAVKRFLGVTLSDKETPIQNLRRLLHRMGMQLTRVKQLGDNRNKQRVRRIERVSSHQDAIFRHWVAQLPSTEEGERDRAAA